MKAYTSTTHGRNHYFYGKKEHTTPKASNDRKGTRSSVRQKGKRNTLKELHELPKAA